MRRGFTLLEVVVSLSVVLALAALVMPAVSRRLGAATGEAMSREIRGAVREARSEAIRTSTPLLIEFDLPASFDGAGEVRLIAREFAASQPQPSPLPERFVGPILDDPVAAPIAPELEPREVVLLVLPRGTRVARETPVVEFGPDGEPVVETDIPADFDEFAGEQGFSRDGGSGLCLGVALPAGGAIAGAPIYITLPGSWTLEVALDAWTCDVAVTRWEPPSPEDDLEMSPDLSEGQEP